MKNVLISSANDTERLKYPSAMCFALERFALKAILDRYLVRLPALVAFLSFAISIDDAFFPVLKKILRSAQAKV